jgi:hypothetical protein
MFDGSGFGTEKIMELEELALRLSGKSFRDEQSIMNVIAQVEWDWRREPPRASVMLDKIEQMKSHGWLQETAEGLSFCFQ